MRDFKEFLDGSVVVTFSSEEELKEFLKLCESRNVTWRYGASLAFKRMLGKKTTVKQDVYAVGDIVLIKKKWKSSIPVPDMDFMLGNAYEIIRDRGEQGIEDGHRYRLKVCSGDIKSYADYWEVCHSDIKGKVI